VLFVALTADFRIIVLFGEIYSGIDKLLPETMMTNALPLHHALGSHLL
jgi:hypothetical protein